MTERRGELTRIGDPDSDRTALEGCSVQGQGLLQAVGGSELDVAKPLGPLLFTILHNPDADNLAAGEKVRHGVLSGIVREIAKVGGVRRSVGNALREVIPRSIGAWEGKARE